MKIFIACLIMVFAGDILFFSKPEGAVIGLGLGVYCGLAFLVISILKSRTLFVKVRPFVFILCILSLLPLIGDVNLLSLSFAVIGLSAFTLTAKYGTLGTSLLTAQKLALFWCSIPWKLALDLALIRKILRFRTKLSSFQFVISWVLPAGLIAVFLTLFSMANPVLENWLVQLKSLLGGSKVDASFLSFERVIFWLILTALIWPFLRPSFLGYFPKASILGALQPHALEKKPSRRWLHIFLSPESITRSLILCNLLFALQSVMDLSYLWGGVTLPKELTFAESAQKGVFPLIVAALLAACFILLSSKSLEGNPEKGRKIKSLMFIWVLQMILLTGSCYLRMYLYISAYSLTYSRLIALVLILLIAFGLMWMIIRLVFEKSSLWLVKVNSMTVIVVLYAFCFIDSGYVISQFNVTHAREVGGQGVHLDQRYIEELGVSSLPALQWYYDNRTQTHRTPHDDLILMNRINNLSKILDINLANWRGYTFRNYHIGYIYKMLKASKIETPEIKDQTKN